MLWFVSLQFKTPHGALIHDVPLHDALVSMFWVATIWVWEVLLPDSLVRDSWGWNTPVQDDVVHGSCLRLLHSAAHNIRQNPDDSNNPGDLDLSKLQIKRKVEG